MVYIFARITLMKGVNVASHNLGSYCVQHMSWTFSCPNQSSRPTISSKIRMA